MTNYGTYRTTVSADAAKLDLKLVHDGCGQIVCDVQHDDEIAVLMLAADAHDAECPHAHRDVQETPPDDLRGEPNLDATAARLTMVPCTACSIAATRTFGRRLSSSMGVGVGALEWVARQCVVVCAHNARTITTKTAQVATPHPNAFHDQSRRDFVCAATARLCATRSIVALSALVHES